GLPTKFLRGAAESFEEGIIRARLLERGDGDFPARARAGVEVGGDDQLADSRRECIQSRGRILRGPPLSLLRGLRLPKSVHVHERGRVRPPRPPAEQVRGAIRRSRRRPRQAKYDERRDPKEYRTHEESSNGVGG